MEWSRRVKPAKIRRLYRSARMGIYDDDALEDVGSQLYARCADIVIVAGAFREGQVPCPQCGTKVQRQIDPMYFDGQPYSSSSRERVEQADSLEDRGRLKDWFHCPHCTKRLIWGEFRKALRKNPRCFACLTPLRGTDELRCRCGKVWDPRAYHRSVGVRVRLPCPHCNIVVRKPTSSAAAQEPEHQPSNQESPGYQPSDQHVKYLDVSCPKCKDATAVRIGGDIKCTGCSYKRRWRDYRKGLKRRDEKLECTACKHTFRWQAWRQSITFLTTGNPYPAQNFVERWPRCRTPQARMMQIDFLLQTLHGQGPMAPMFIEGNERSVRHLLDELAE